MGAFPGDGCWRLRPSNEAKDTTVVLLLARERLSAPQSSRRALAAFALTSVPWFITQLKRASLPLRSSRSLIPFTGHRLRNLTKSCSSIRQWTRLHCGFASSFLSSPGCNAPYGGDVSPRTAHVTACDKRSGDLSPVNLKMGLSEFSPSPVANVRVESQTRVYQTVLAPEVDRQRPKLRISTFSYLSSGAFNITLSRPCSPAVLARGALVFARRTTSYVFASATMLCASCSQVYVPAKHQVQPSTHRCLKPKLPRHLRDIPLKE